jgi:hypothetical protein
LDQAGIEQLVAGIASIQKPIIVNSAPAQVKITPAPAQMPPIVHVDVKPTQVPVNVANKVDVKSAKKIKINRDKAGKITGAEVAAE